MLDSHVPLLLCWTLELFLK